jgi:excinuclease UvrABC ATPase subunit
VKLAAQLGREGKAAHALIFDEPTPGLHLADIGRLLGASRAWSTRGTR